MRAIIVVFLLLLPLQTYGVSSSIKEVRYSSSKEKTRIVLEFEGSIPHYRVGQLRNPTRVYIDLKDTIYSKTRRFNLDDAYVKRIRFGWPEKRTLRVVFDIEDIRSFRVFTLSFPNRLVIDFNKKITKGVVPFYNRKRIIVIDPGHGGHDPGAIGPGGVKEKDLTLDIAKRLKRILEQKYNYKVYLTRDKDRFISLKERTAFANRLNADLFVSIHINAHNRRSMRGLETYLLNWTNDEEALRVAARENKISFKKMKMKRTDLGIILASLQRDGKRDESLRLAHIVHSSMVKTLKKSYKGIRNKGVKQAMFYVLLGAEMPSILIEAGYISNPREERLLRRGDFREKTARAIAKGIFRYIQSLPDEPKLALLRKNLAQL